jgi:hypothetical protein
MRRVLAVWVVFDVGLVWHQGVLICWLQDGHGLPLCLGKLFSVESTLIFLVFCDARLCSVSDLGVLSSLKSGTSVIRRIAQAHEANTTYCMRAIVGALKGSAAVQTGEDRAQALIAVRIEFLLGQDISTRLYVCQHAGCVCGTGLAYLAREGDHL